MISLFLELATYERNVGRNIYKSNAYKYVSYCMYVLKLWLKPSYVNGYMH